MKIRPPGRQHDLVHRGRGNCVGALLGGVIAARFGLAAPYWVGFAVAIIVSAATWRVFDRATVVRAYTTDATVPTSTPG